MNGDGKINLENAVGVFLNHMDRMGSGQLSDRSHVMSSHYNLTYL